MASTFWLCVFYSYQPCERGASLQHVDICVSSASSAIMSGWSVCIIWRLSSELALSFFALANCRMGQLYWLCVYKTLQWPVKVLYEQHQDKGDNNGKLQLWSIPPSSLSFECPLAVHPIQVISILQRSTAIAKAKSKRECVLIRGTKSRAYEALPPLRAITGPQWAQD